MNEVTNTRFAGVRRFASKSKSLAYAAVAGAMALPITLFAEGESASGLDLSAAEGAADDIGSAISDLITGKILDNVKLVVGASLAVWGLFLVVRYVRRGGK